MKKFEGWLIASDMDATLIDSQHRISKENTEAIKYFIENGGRFTVASGRMVQAVRVFLEAVPINAPAIVHNGAKIYDFKTEKTLFEKDIEEERKPAIRRAYEDMPELGIEIYCDEVIYVYRECSQTKRIKRNNYKAVYSLPDEIWNKPWVKVLLIGDNKKILNKYEPIYRRDYDDGYCVRSGPLFLDIVAGGISKGTGVREVAKICGCDKIVTVGDAKNDIEMLSITPYSFAVENAAKEAKDTAEFSAPSNDDSAIAYVIDKISSF